MMPILLFFTLLLPRVLLADVLPIPGSQRVAPVFEGSDLVCYCAVESLRITEERTVERGGKPLIQRRVIAAVRIKDSYNRDIQTGAKVFVAFEDEIPRTGSLPTLSGVETALMFLKRSSAPLYEFADRSLGVTPFASLPIQQGPLGLSKLQAALAGALQQTNSTDQINAMRLLEGFDELNPESLAAVKGLESSGDAEIAFSSIAVLLKAKVAGTAQALRTYLKTHSITRLPFALLSVSDELAAGTNIDDLSALGELTASDILSIKLGAMAGVRRIRSSQSAPALVARLDDPNADVRFLAVITLSEIFEKGGDYAPDMRAFAQNPDLYTTKWKTWWTQEGRNQSP